MLTSSDIRTLQEAYEAVYDDELRSEIMSDDYDELDILDELDDDELDEIVEEIVYEMLDEGYDFDDVEYIFEDVLVEARVDMAARKARRQADVAASEKSAREARGRARRKRLGDAVKGALSRAGEMARSAGKKVGEVGSKVGKEVQFHSGNVATRAKAGATRAAMKATGVSPMDIPKQSGGRRKSADTFVAGRKSDRSAARTAIKKRIGDLYRGAKASAGIAGSIAKDEARRAGRSAMHSAGKAAQAVKDAPGRAMSAAKGALKGAVGRAARGVSRGARNVARRLGEEVETFDIVLDFLLSEGIAETLEEAQWLMVNELDYEDVGAILEAYEVLDESQIMSVSGKGGRLKYKINRNIERAQNAAARARQRNQGRGNSAKSDQDYERLERTTKKNIERLNAKPGEDDGSYDSGYYGDDDTSGGTRHYGLSRTNQSARRRRASGR